MRCAEARELLAQALPRVDPVIDLERIADEHLERSPKPRTSRSGLEADEAVAGPRVATDDALEQKAPRRGAESRERGHGCDPSARSSRVTGTTVAPSARARKPLGIRAGRGSRERHHIVGMERSQSRGELPCRNESLASVDPEIGDLIEREKRRQHDKVRLIPSENYAWPGVMEACGSVLERTSTPRATRTSATTRASRSSTPSRRSRWSALKSLFGAAHANVQPYSGSPANLAVYFAFCKPGDTVMGLGPAERRAPHARLEACRSRASTSTRVQYGVRRDDHRIDFDEVAQARARAQAEAPVVRRDGVLEGDRLREVRGDRARGRGDPRRRHRAHLGAHRRRRAPVAGRHRGGGHVDDAQDVPRTARRDDPLRRRARAGDRPGGVPGAAGRAAQRDDRRHRGGGEARGDATTSRRTRRKIVENARAMSETLMSRGIHRS